MLTFFTEVAREIIDALVTAKKHEITILSRTVRKQSETLSSSMMILMKLRSFLQKTAGLVLPGVL